jgi:branched-chain amino acid transport system substrate-binding protein
VNSHEIRVGLSVSKSGRYQLQGEQALNGVLLWQSHSNAQAGIRIGELRRPVRLICYDDAGRISQTQENVSRLVREDGVDILLGPYSSHLTIAAAQVAAEYKKLLWNYGGTSDEIFRRGWKHVIGIASPASDYFRALPYHIAKQDPEVRRICVAYSAKGSFASYVAYGLMESATIGHSVSLLRLTAPIHVTEVFVSALRNTNPDAVVLAGSFEHEVSLMRTRTQWPATVRAIGCVAAGMNAFPSALGRDAESVIGPSQWEPALRAQVFLGPRSDWFVENFQQRFQSTPDYVAAGSFATGLILAECIRKAGTLDESELWNIASSLQSTTLYGDFRISPESGRQLGHQILLVQWRQGEKIAINCENNLSNPVT